MGLPVRFPSESNLRRVSQVDQHWPFLLQPRRQGMPLRSGVERTWHIPAIVMGRVVAGGQCLQRKTLPESNPTQSLILSWPASVVRCSIALSAMAGTVAAASHANGRPRRDKKRYDWLVAHLVRDEGVAGSNPATWTNGIMSGPETSVTERSDDMGDNLGPNEVVEGLQGVLLQSRFTR